MNAFLRILRPIGGAFEFATVTPVPARLAGTLSGPVLGALPVVGAALGVLAAFVTWVMHFAYMAPLAGLAAGCEFDRNSAGPVDLHTIKLKNG